jgi:hypothetical protein
MTEKLEQTMQAVAAAHDAHVRDAIESVQWERRGLLQRLVRTEWMRPQARDRTG